jgi:hypothetical protein
MMRKDPSCGCVGSTRPSPPIALKQMDDLPVCHAIFACDLEGSAVHKIQQNRVGEFLTVEIRYVGKLEVLKRVSLRNCLLMFHRLWNGEDDIAGVVDFDDATFPEL